MYISIWVTSPILAYGTVYRVLALLLIVVWLILELTQKNGVLRKPTSYILILYLFLLYTVPVIILEDGPMGLIRNTQLYIMIFFIFVYASYQRKSLEILKPVIYLSIILLTVWMVTTYMALMVDSHASRILVRSSEEAMDLANSGVGGFAFVYSLLIYIIAIIAVIKNRFKQKKRLSITTLFLIFSVLLAILVVLKAEYTTALLLLVISLAYFFFCTKSLRKNILILLISMLMLLAFKEYMTDILQSLQPYVEGTNYRHKIADSIDSAAAGEAVGTAADRKERYVRSIMIFLENPLLGVWSVWPVGKHSLILDTFAQFGFFAGIALVYIVFKIPYQIFKRQKKNKNLALTILFLILGLSLLNNVTMTYGFMFYLFYPYIIDELEKA